MGYNMQIHGRKFHIAAADVPVVLAAIKGMQTQENRMSGGVSTNGKVFKRYFSWMNDVDFASFSSLEDAMDSWSWPIELNEAGDVVGIEFEAEKMGDEDVLFEVIAPWVRPGSFIEMVGEEGDTWRWVFDGVTCKQIDAVKIWPVVEPVGKDDGWPAPWMPE